jgi:hypothetical protein
MIEKSLKRLKHIRNTKKIPELEVAGLIDLMVPLRSNDF